MRTLLITAAAALGLTVGLAPAAAAGRLVREDAPRDVVKWNVVDESETVVPQRKDPDLRRVTVDYRQGALVIRAKYAALPRLVGRTELVFVANRDTFMSAEAEVSRKGRWQGRTTFDGVSSDDRCPGGRHRFDYDNRVSIWTIPPACVNRSPWVQVAFDATVGGGARYFSDDAFTNGKGSESGLSARIWRG